ncbi:MAG: S9 family peptidase, partial [Gammaproteobacteria bacterium]
MLKHTLIPRCALILAGALIAACGKSPEETVVIVTDGVSAAVPGEAMMTAPVTRIEAVEDVYHGQTVVDPYRWLEDWDDPEVRSWSEGQNAYARAALAALPERPAVQT